MKVDISSSHEVEKFNLHHTVVDHVADDYSRISCIEWSKLDSYTWKGWSDGYIDI